MNKKKVILSSVLTIALCLCLIAGSTFALFTSYTETNIAVTAGNVKVVAGLTDPILYSVAPLAANATVANGTETVEDENGKTYVFEEQVEKFANGGTAVIENGVLKLSRITPGDRVVFNVTVENQSDVAIWNRFFVRCLNGYGLMSGLKVSINDATYTALDTYESAWSDLGANETIDDIEIVVELPVDAGNEYQGLTTEINVFVEAVQGNASIEGEETVTYIQKVTDSAAVAAALENGGSVVLGDNVVLDESSWTENNTIKITKDTVLELLGYDLDASASARRPFELYDGADLTVVATNSTVKVGNYGFVYIPDGASNVTLIGGNYVANTDNGAFLKPKGDDPIRLEMTDVTLTDTSARNFIVDGKSYMGEKLDIVVNGGSFDTAGGIVMNSGSLMINEATLNVTMAAVEVGKNAVGLVENATITVANGTFDPSAPNACIAASRNGSVKVNNCTLTSDVHVLVMYSGVDTTIEANGCTMTNTGAYDTVAVYGDANIANITVNN